MSLRVSGKNMDVGDALRGKASDRIDAAVGKYFDGGYDGHLTLDDAIQQTIHRTTRYAKRQLTWFRNQANVRWLPVTPSTDLPSLAHQVHNLWTTLPPTSILH